MELEWIPRHVGATCMVLAEANQLLFMGRLSHYDPVNTVVRVDVRGGAGSTPCWALRPEQRICLHIKQGGGNQFVALEGTVVNALDDYFFLLPQSLLEKSDEREYFRQPVLEDSVVRVHNGQFVQQPCRIADISATGIAIYSRTQYEIGDRLELQGQQLRPGGPVHYLEFLIVRKSERDNVSLPYSYGCKFVNLSDRTQDALFSDIFALQGTKLRRDRG